MFAESLAPFAIAVFFYRRNRVRAAYTSLLVVAVVMYLAAR
jgi:hypothetical protein